MSLFKNPFELMKEAYVTEDCEVLDTDIDDVECDIEDVYDDLEEIDEDVLFYTEEMVHVIEQQLTDEKSRYLVEVENLAKYMMSSGVKDFAEAISNIARHNEIDKGSIYIVIESKDNMVQLLEEAKKVKRSLAKSRGESFKSTIGIIKMMKTKGLQVLKKSSKSKKKK